MSLPVIHELDSDKVRSIKEIAYGLIECWNAMDFHRAYTTYYAEDAVKCEPTAIGDFPNEIQGLENLIAQEDSIQQELMETHQIQVAEGPFIGANGFSVIIKSDFTHGATNTRHIFREVGIFTIADGKVVREEYQFDEAEYQLATVLAAEHAE